MSPLTVTSQEPHQLPTRGPPCLEGGGNAVILHFLQQADVSDGKFYSPFGSGCPSAQSTPVAVTAHLMELGFCDPGHLTRGLYTVLAQIEAPSGHAPCGEPATPRATSPSSGLEGAPAAHTDLSGADDRQQHRFTEGHTLPT